ncbi:MAG TPA: SdpI family protein [Allosphingosinicella sp.]|jgi:uncharacterized membrane protein
MSDDPNLSAFKKKLLLVAPLLIAAVSLPMALGVVPPNRVYGFRTSASLASPEVWYSSNLWAGGTGVALGLAGAFLTYRMLKSRPLSAMTAATATGIALSALFLSSLAGLLAS